MNRLTSQSTSNAFQQAKKEVDMRRIEVLHAYDQLNAAWATHHEARQRLMASEQELGRLTEPAKPTKDELLALLRRVESILANENAFNAWDLGPSKILIDVRKSLGFAQPAAKGQR